MKSSPSPYPLPTGEGVILPEWRTAKAPVGYPEAVATMEERVRAIRAGEMPELVWLLEHPPLYTAGTSADPADLVEARFPVFASGRGGQYTYHGPGQRVAYVMLDLARRGPDLKRYIHDLEAWLIGALSLLGITAGRRAGRVGLWIDMADHGGQGDSKIAAIGVRVRRWVTFHGVSINVDPDLSHFSGIVPCGIREHGVTSLAALGCTASMEDVDRALKAAWDEGFARQLHDTTLGGG